MLRSTNISGEKLPNILIHRSTFEYLIFLLFLLIYFNVNCFRFMPTVERMTFILRPILLMFTFLRSCYARVLFFCCCFFCTLSYWIWIIFKQIYLTHKCNPNRVREDQGVVKLKTYTTLPSAQVLYPCYQIQFSALPCLLIWRRVFSSAGNTVSVF